jgi:hypothetical protein
MMLLLVNLDACLNVPALGIPYCIQEMVLEGGWKKYNNNRCGTVCCCYLSDDVMAPVGT